MPLTPEQRGTIEAKKAEALRKRDVLAKECLGPQLGTVPRRTIATILDFLGVAAISSSLVPCNKGLRTRVYSHYANKARDAGVGARDGLADSERFELSALWCRVNEVMTGLKRPRPVRVFVCACVCACVYVRMFVHSLAV
jgi:hypothetical protein